MKLLPRPFLNPSVPVTCAVHATPALLKTINFDSFSLCNIGGRHSRTVHGDPWRLYGKEGGVIKEKSTKKKKKNIRGTSATAFLPFLMSPL